MIHKTSRKGSNTLMQIDHAHWLFKLLKKIENGKSKKQIENLLIEISEEKISPNSKSLQMYRYWLTTLNLLNELNKEKKYTLTDLGKSFCKEYPQNKIEYQSMLGSILLRNKRVGSFFKKYLDIIKQRSNENNPITRNEIRSFFQGETERALYSLSYEAGLITKTKQGKLNVKSKKKINPSLRQFKNMVQKYYVSQISNTNGLHLQKHYIEIYKIRELVSSKFGWEDNKQFDDMFTELLYNSIGKDIQIHGAAPQWYTEKGLKKEDIAFKYEEKIYVFMSFTDK